jgi:acyl carrier protein
LHAIPVLPVTLTGKVDRQSLEAQLSGNDVPAIAAPTSPTAIEQELAEIWKMALRLDAVGLDDNFLQIGGDSISMMMVLDRLEQQYGIRIAPAEFYRRGNIRQLAAHIRNLRKPAASQAGTFGQTLRNLSRRMLDGISNGSSSERSAHAPEPAGTDVRSPATGIMPPPEQELGRAESRKVTSVESVSDGYVEMLAARGVEYIFINPGTDTAPILESIAKFSAQGRAAPKLILCLHESVAMAAAHGHFMISGKPQVVLVHVDVGTQNIGANMHNAQRGRAGVVVCAGIASRQRRWCAGGSQHALTPAAGTIQPGKHRRGLRQVALRAHPPGQPPSCRAARVPGRRYRPGRTGISDTAPGSPDA